jgi:hypothetical protein
VEIRKTVHHQMPANPCDNRVYAQIIEGLGVQSPVNRRETNMTLLGLCLLLNQLKFVSNELRMPNVALT